MDEIKSLPSDSYKSSSSGSGAEKLPEIPSAINITNLDNDKPDDITAPIHGATLKERICSSTKNGGLKKVPENFDFKDGDWNVVKSDNPFEVLYLDYKQYKIISPEMVKQNYEILRSFWENKIDVMDTGATKAQIVSKYGGEHGTEKTIKNYQILLNNAYEKLKNGVESCFLEIDTKRKNTGRQQLLPTIAGILADGIYEPTEKDIIFEIGREAKLRDDEIEEYFEKELIEHGFSPDPDTNIKDTDTIHDKLAVIWRTSEKHFEVSRNKFHNYLVGKLHNGIYTPDDYVSISEAATGFLRRDAVKLKATLIDYLKKNEFSPVGKPTKPGNELAVLWKTEWAILPRKKLFWKVVLAFGIVAVLGSGLLLYKGKESKELTGLKTGQTEMKLQPKAKRPSKTKREVVGPSKPQAERGDNKQQQAVLYLNDEREKIRKEAERDTLNKVEAERQRQGQVDRQREIDDYLSDGKRFFENGKYELCIEKMREVVKRDNSNREAKQYIQMASEKINDIKRQFSNPTFGASE